MNRAPTVAGGANREDRALRIANRGAVIEPRTLEGDAPAESGPASNCLEEGT